MAMTRLLGWLAMTGCLSASAVQAQSPPLFAVSDAIVTGQQSGHLVIADVDGDGRSDLVVQHLLQGEVVVHFGAGDGSFSARQVIRPELEPAAIAVGDWTSDGRPDLAIASRDPRSHVEFVSIFPGETGSQFSPTPTVRYETGHAEYYKPVIEVADINEDEVDDLVYANARRASIEILLSEGTGGLSPAPPVELEDGFVYHSFDLGDIDGDGHLDLLVASEGDGGLAHRLAVWPGDGRGGWGTARSIEATLEGRPRLVAVWDMSGETRPDLVLAEAEGRRLAILLNDGAGGFSPAPNSPFVIGAEAFDVAGIDANRDGVVDLFAATGDSVAVLLGAGRSFATLEPPLTVRPGAYDIVAGDLNGDSYFDLVVSSFEGESATLLIGR
jgi:hypothetical protein